MPEHKHIAPVDAPAWTTLLDDIQNGRIGVQDRPVDWRDNLPERQRQELDLAALYNTPEFRHGTTGHNQLILIDELATFIDFILDNYQLTPKD